MDMRLRLEAESWIDALKAGLAKVGEGGAAAENVLCDIKPDNSIHVTDAASGRVFQIRELAEHDADAAATETGATEPELAAAATTPQMAAAEAVPTTPPAEPIPTAPPATPPAEPIPTAPPATPPAEPIPTAPPATPPAEPTPTAPPAAPAADAIPTAPPAPAPEVPYTTTESGIGRALDLTSEATADLLEEIFELTSSVEQKADRGDALYFMLDVAINTLGTDAGSVLLTDLSSDDLHFGAARGPKAQEVMQFTVRMGQGIVGFCAENAVGLAVSDAERDPRFYAAISEKIGYPTRSILCVPVQDEGEVVGALELINKKSSDTFNERDLGVASFIGQQLARYLLRRR
jgi:putative methionine-R-sulfoxide reductase with GAF domain